MALPRVMYVTCWGGWVGGVKDVDGWDVVCALHVVRVGGGVLTLMLGMLYDGGVEWC